MAYFGSGTERVGFRRPFRVTPQPPDHQKNGCINPETASKRRENSHYRHSALCKIQADVGNPPQEKSGCPYDKREVYVMCDMARARDVIYLLCISNGVVNLVPSTDEVSSQSFLLAFV